jgi:hypothetical protein
VPKMALPAHTTSHSRAKSTTKNNAEWRLIPSPSITQPCGGRALFFISISFPFVSNSPLETQTIRATELD